MSIEFVEEGVTECAGAAHPLLAALIGTLPKTKPWAAADREEWLDLVRRAFNVVYGRDTGASASTFTESGGPVGGGMTDAVVRLRAPRPAVAARALDDDESSVAG